MYLYKVISGGNFADMELTFIDFKIFQWNMFVYYSKSN